MGLVDTRWTYVPKAAHCGPVDEYLVHSEDSEEDIKEMLKRLAMKCQMLKI
jgi:hypothetical protein